jgi:hypothetical protein
MRESLFLWSFCTSQSPALTLLLGALLTQPISPFLLWVVHTRTLSIMGSLIVGSMWG